MSDWTLVEDDVSLQEIAARYRGADAVAVDTEFMRRNTFFPQPALLQLNFDDHAWLIDPLKISNLGPIRDLFQDVGTVKVLHSPSEDLEVFQHWLGVQPQPLFDTQKAAAFCGLDFGLGYRALVEHFTGIDLPKGETRSDWLQRPLTQSQCHYAAQDVTHLLGVYRKLHALLVEQGKLDWVLEEGDIAARGATQLAPPIGRIKNAWRLSPRQLAALGAICDWREETAIQRDKPRNWIIDDRACYALAEALPGRRREVEALDVLPPPALRRYSDALLELVAEAIACPDAELPHRLPAPLDAAQRNQLKQLKSRARELAEQLGTAPEALLPGRDYELLVRRLSGDDGAEPAHWQGWRREVVLEPLLKSQGEPS